jgi:hypothetical protein
MENLFYTYCSSKENFNGDVSLWDVSRVTSMSLSKFEEILVVEIAGGGVDCLDLVGGRWVHS